MTAGQFDLNIEQGATYLQEIYWHTDTQPSYPQNVTSYTAKLQMRPAYASPTALLTMVTNPSPDSTVYNSSAYIAVGSTNGLVSLYIAASVTLGFTWTSAVYDLDLISPGGFVTRLLQGNVIVSPGVTDI